MFESDRTVEHGLVCKEWGLMTIIAALWAIPVAREYFMSLLSSGFAQSAISLVFLAIVGRKFQVWSWEAGFKDGGDDIPDLRLYDGGDGNGVGLRAFMPGVVKASWFTPLSRFFGQSKRKVAVLLPDGRVSFPVWPVSWVSTPGNAGNWMPVPGGWAITAEQGAVLQEKRDAIKRKGALKWTEYDTDFMAFTELIFGANAVVAVAEPRIDISVDYRIGQLEARVHEHSQVFLRDFNEIFARQTKLIDLGERFAKWEKARPVALAKLRERVKGVEARLKTNKCKGECK